MVSFIFPFSYNIRNVFNSGRGEILLQEKKWEVQRVN